MFENNSSCNLREGGGTLAIPLAIVSPNSFEKLVVFSFTILLPILGSSSSVFDFAIKKPNPCFISSSKPALALSR